MIENFVFIPNYFITLFNIQFCQLIQSMYKSIFVCLISVLVTVKSFNILPLLEQNGENKDILSSQNKDKLNQIIINDEEIQKGASITASIMNQIKGHIQTAFVYSGNDYWKNVAWIQSKLNQSYPGDWLISIYNSTNGQQIVPNKTIGISTYSLNGSWWIYWRGVNHYQTSLAYYINRGAPNTYNRSANVFCHALYNSTSSYSCTDTFRNIINAVESDTSALMDEASKIQSYLHSYNPNITANILISKKVPFFACQWGVIDSNYISSSYNPNNNTLISFPKV